MELELRRHSWGSLQGVSGDARSLEGALRELANADSREVALAAAGRIERVVFAQGLLTQASTALASGLVHCLWRCSGFSEDLVLGLLSDISAAVASEEDPNIYGPTSEAECMKEISLGYPAYVEILEMGATLDSRTACIDLILMCGLFDTELRSRSVYFLESAQGLAGLEGHGALIAASIEELRDAG
jgi:hypothetical protein